MNTQGWDTVYIVSLDRINSALERNLASLIQEFDQEGEKGFPVSAKGAFSKWEVVDGGSGQIVSLRITVRKGTATFLLEENRTVDISDVQLVVALHLQIVSEGKSNHEYLKMNIKQTGEEGQTPKPGMLTPVRLLDPSGRLRPIPPTHKSPCSHKSIAWKWWIHRP